MTPAVHQFIPSFVPGTAVSDHTLQVQRLLHDLGVRSEIYVGEAKGEYRRRSHPFRDYDVRVGERTWLLYQSSTGSPIVEYLLARREPKIVNYHNMTPARFFAAWEPHVAAELEAGRRQLVALAGTTQLAIADSGYNRDELDALGYGRSVVVPILLDLTDHGAVDDRVLDRLASPVGVSSTWLFVGRIAPNKAQHDLMKALAVYRRVYDPSARLRLVGGSSSHAYATALESLRSALQLDDAVDLVGAVSDEELAAHYRAADVFVCLSDHEGFCVPLLEAMHHRLPIVAYAAGAVPETLGTAGLCLPAKAPTTVAAAVHRVVGDHTLRDRLVSAGAARLTEFDLARTSQRMASVLRELVA